MEYKYEIQHRIETLAKVSMVDASESCSFSLDEICFSSWGGDFSFLTSAEHDFWLAKGAIEASNLKDAVVSFNRNLAKLIPRIALISQCYIEFSSQPFLVKRFDRDFAYFRYTQESEGVGLMFGDEERKALDVLLKNNEIPEAFYCYWNDMVNSIGYSTKILLMCCALEAFAKVGPAKNNKTKFYQKIEEILGPDLKEDLWGTPKDPNSGIRQRLVHGEYLSRCDVMQDYAELVHHSIIQYFNSSILKEKLLSESVECPPNIGPRIC